MEPKTVLVTGIGGNVGQGIVRNIRATGFPIRVVGCNVSAFSAGNYLVDAFRTVPYAFDPSYATQVAALVKREKIDLILPSTDYEVYHLALNRAIIGCEVAASEAETASIYLDKLATFHHHSKYGIAFAASILPSQYQGEFAECIAKPKAGRGSRGLYFNPTVFSEFSDDEYMVQEMHRGEEITTAFYVTRAGKLHGAITLSRTLENGATNSCKVVTEYDAPVLAILKQMVAASSIRGAANLQSIVRADGRVVPFEVNCRISGTNSIRSNFGFADVRYTLQEWLYGQAPDAPDIRPGVAVRILLDVIYPGQTSFDALPDNSVPHFIF
jgi:carbamoyl-phosphate synthase large subunit